LRVGTRDKVGDRLFLGPVALVERPCRRAGDQLEGAIGSGRGAVHGVVDERADTPDHGLEVGPVRLTAFETASLRKLEREFDRAIDELDRL
jgi:hypothetical protein